MDTNRLLRDLAHFLRIPSGSTSPTHNADCRAAGEWVAGELRRLGCREVQFLASGTHPVVWGVGPEVPGAPTLAIYGHYDVQPPDPLDEWVTPPFEPSLRDGFLFARGADDNKGQIMCGVRAAELAFAAGGPPVNLRFFIEGEEEVGGPSLPALKARDGRISVPGFYDGAIPPDERELAHWRSLPVSEEDQKTAMGVPALEGELAFSPLERRWARPTLDVHGILGGFQGEGQKTVIPARARAKISMRLVPGQDPDRIFDTFAEYVGSLSTPGVKITARKLSQALAVRTGTD